jgi:aminoglycoside phosphotransferase (APT) family kinase protein
VVVPAEIVGLEAVQRAAVSFAPGEVFSVEARGSGHIHDTFLVQVRTPAGAERLIVQRFNEHVFADIAAVMSNIVRVTEHAHRRLLQRAVPDLARRVLTPRRTDSGLPYFRDADGTAFRAFEYVQDSLAAGVVRGPRMAFEAGRAFGEFADLLRDLPAPPLLVTIPGFHDAAARLAALRSALAEDPWGRAREVQREWESIEQHAALATECSELAQRGSLVLRVTHNDAKLDNVLFDATTEAALCVVDLDTVMPGYLAHDFSDLVRTTACLGGEDALDLSQVRLRLDCFEALAAGYLQEVGAWLLPEERATLVLGAAWIPFELALRFLTDYVLGDRYFKIARPNHNLDRARVQLRLIQTFEQQRDALLRVWETLSRRSTEPRSQH